MSEQFDLDRKTASRPAPAKRWRNKWLILRPFEGLCLMPDGSFCAGHKVSANEARFSCDEWPSKEIAEQKASVVPAPLIVMETTRRHLTKYLGAFPVDAQ